ncbi:MAG: DUF4367 domain-containing protein [Firmicutes bacterium]|nr:DUF4367 domain-containing protein [Bacillota bacterium]
MSNNLYLALNQASYNEFNWLESFENPYKNHKFSQGFERKMLDICQSVEYDHVGVGNPKFRKKLVLILVALLALIISSCAIAHYYINWAESQNDNHGTLDVEFDVDGTLPVIDVHLIYPSIPDGYKESDVVKDNDTFMIEYKNDFGVSIIYTQEIGVQNLSVSINNETTIFEEITINGYKGYHSEHEGVNMYVWIDGYCLYTLQGTCPNEALLEIIESIQLPDN